MLYSPSQKLPQVKCSSQSKVESLPNGLNKEDAIPDKETKRILECEKKKTHILLQTEFQELNVRQTRRWSA